MTKQEIKARLLEAIQTDPYRGDIKSVSLFGSYITGSATDASDVDVLIDFEPQAQVGLFEFVRIQRHFGETIGKKVDLLTPQAISKHIKDAVLRQAELVYAR